MMYPQLQKMFTGMSLRVLHLKEAPALMVSTADMKIIT